MKLNYTFATILGLLAVLLAETSAGTISFQYDGAGRLTRAAFESNKFLEYAYDLAGNLLSRQISAPSTVPDSDSDGIDDAWENLYFGNLGRDGTGDFDQDGFIDRNEFLAGTLPNNSGSGLKLQSNPSVTPDSVTLQWQAVPGKNYMVQFKNSLSDSWTNLPGEVSANSGTASKTDTTKSGQPHRFYRILLVP